MSTQPEDEPCVFAVPAAPFVVAEEAPRVPVVLVLHEHPHATTAQPVADVFPRRHEFLPHDGEEQGTGGVHDGDVGELPVFVVGLEGFDHQQEEWMGGDGAHGVVGNAGRGGAADPCRVGQEGIQPSIAALMRAFSGGLVRWQERRGFLSGGRGDTEQLTSSRSI